MKRIIMSLFAACFSLGAAFAASSVVDLSSRPAEREKYEIQRRGTGARARKVRPSENLYYIRPAKRDTSIYDSFGGCGDKGCDNVSRSVRSDIKRIEDERKYNLVNPFFQPRAKQFASVTNLGYEGNSFDITMLDDNSAWGNYTAKFNADAYAVTEHISFGATDDISIIGTARYSITDVKINWSDPAALPVDKQEDNRFDLWGIGAQWRFVNNDLWIGSVLGAYQQLIDSAGIFTAEAKVGYKNDDTTLYGLARLQYLDWKGTGYGVGLKNQLDQTIYFPLDYDAKSSFYYDIGAGIFAALNTDWSANLELTYSDMEWHSRLGGMASVSYQPWKNFAISFYGRVTLWDNADGFKTGAFDFSPNDPLTQQGIAKFGDYADVAAGLTATILF